MPALGDFMKSQGREVEIIKEDVALFKNLIKERKHQLDLLRELLSNAGAKQVGASRLEISYTKDKEGHIFEVYDNGCGMNFTGSKDMPGRLDRFLGLGLSGIVGRESDEFSWKGLGSKLAYQSRRVEITTRFTGQSLYDVVINEPWDTLDRNLIPKPRINEHENPDEAPHTKIKVYGHPPHSTGQPFSAEQIKAFLLHRTFLGFTDHRDTMPELRLSVLGENIPIEFGFPEFRGIEWPTGLRLDTGRKTLFVNLQSKSQKTMRVRIMGFLTWRAEDFGLSSENLNTGLILSSKGIPFFGLKMQEYGADAIEHANPGEAKTCLVIECADVFSEMNIARSDLVDSEKTVLFKQALKELMQTLQGSAEYREFRQLHKIDKRIEVGEALSKAKHQLASEDQAWVVFERSGQPKPIVLLRRPENESDVNALLWKLEALGGLPFKVFQTLGYVGASSGPDLLVNFQENADSELMRCIVVEVENNFYAYKSHGHHPPQYPKVLCWDIPSSGRKQHLSKTDMEYKYKIDFDDCQVHVYVLQHMAGVKVMTGRELKAKGIRI